MPLHAEKIADWLLAGLELKSTLFHVGQYCGSWQASTAGHQQASFHVVLHGECWLHLPAKPGRIATSVRLTQGDAVFLLHDMPHCLSPLPVAPPAGQESQRAGSMQPLSSDESPAQQSLGLACGFFEFRSGLDDQLLALIPDHIVARHDTAAPDGPRAVFDLIRAEAQRHPDAPSPLIARLTELLFFYALRSVAARDDIAPGLWSLMRRAEFAPLITAIIDTPAERWTTDRMANFVHMSRARFCKQFVEACGQPPAQFVTLVRMKVAAAMLRNGTTTPDAAEQVGYQSESAFAQAFKRVTGEQPGAYRRTRTQDPVALGFAIDDAQVALH
ncbi:AraC family transcriptional regulator [Caballeronia sp. LjRoot34]|uniref:AraC family transcriptional regulator n=1 Tax=Caballeronia sp. LjRoot34 TaxID=3342325 RepID=UPI003ECF964D